MCEHKWTIVYIDLVPVGISCEHCDESRPIAKDENELKEFHIFSGGVYQIPMPDGRRNWQLNHWEVRNQVRGRSELLLEFLDYDFD